MEKIVIVGHRNPDTDSVCSAIGYAVFKNSTDRENLYIAGRAGELNSETKFVLDKFQVEEPELVETFRLMVKDLQLSPPVSATPNSSVKEVIDLMKEFEIRLIPVINEEGKPLGIVPQSRIARNLVESIGRRDLSKNPVDVMMLCRVLNGRVIANSRGKKILDGKIFIGARRPESLQKSMGKNDILLVGDRYDLIKMGLGIPVEAIILTGGVEIPSDLLQEAQKVGTLLISTHYDTYTTAKLIDLSLPARSLMIEEFPTVFLDEPMEEVKEKVLISRIRGAIALDYEGRTIGIITRTDLINIKRKKVILVDHNEGSQAVDGIEEAEILEVIDHHRIGDISTLRPIYFYVEPIGSTSTIIASFFFQKKVQISKEIAGILLSGIISDTMNLTLSTTTPKDKRIAKRLSSIAGINPENLSRELLKAASRIEGLSPEEIIKRDFKEYVFGRKKVGIGQIITADFSQLKELKKEIIKSMEEIKNRENYSLLGFMLTDPMKKYSEVWAVGEKGIIARAFNTEEKEGAFILKGILSRKKDFIWKIGETIIRGT